MIVDCKRNIFFRKRIFPKNFSDISHSFDRDLVIIKVLYLWSLRWSWRLNAFPQISQGNGLSSVCVRSWINKLYDLEKWRPQNLQMYSFFCLKKKISISIHRYKTKQKEWTLYFLHIQQLWEMIRLTSVLGAMSSFDWQLCTLSYFLCRLPLRSKLLPHFGICRGNLSGIYGRKLEKNNQSDFELIQFFSSYNLNLWLV